MIIISPFLYFSRFLPFSLTLPFSLSPFLTSLFDTYRLHGRIQRNEVAKGVLSQLVEDLLFQQTDSAK